MSVLKAGQVIAGRYRLESEIGEGAMGAVFRAEDETLKRQVAIKFLFVKGARDPRVVVEQFLREARIAASVQHRNVIQTVDFGSFDDQPFMVMELLSGESLGERLEREPRLTREQLLHLVSLTLRGLSAVHDAGIVHRDLKPQNVFLQRDADAVYPKILDFGISRSVQRTAERPSAIATVEGLIVGTPDYMSPEQARGDGNVDKRSDIYSMGVILYEGMSGRLPFQTETVGELIVQLVTKEPPRLHELDPTIPRPLSDLVATAMTKQREGRFADARAMRRALLAAIEASTHPQATPVVASLGPPPVRAASPSSRTEALGSGSATWGDFEGLGIVDNGVPSAAAASPREPARDAQPSRVAPAEFAFDATLDGGLPQLAQPEVQAPAPAQRERKTPDRVSAERGSTERGSAAQARRPSKPRAAIATDSADALNPLYAGSAEVAPDIDYIRAGTAAPRKQAARLSSARVRDHGRPERAEQRPARKHTRAIVLGVVLLGAIAALFVQRSLSEEQPGGARPVEARMTELRLEQKGRREKPGAAPAHMRDVVFR